MAKKNNEAPKAEKLNSHFDQSLDQTDADNLKSPLVNDGADDLDDSAQSDRTLTPEERINELEAELAELKDKSLRALADAENTRRRAEREVADAKKFGPSGLVKDLLNVSDNLHRALGSVGGETHELNETTKNLILGVEMVEKDFLTAFEKHGVKRLEPLGEKFNHEFHQAMYEVEAPGQPAGMIVELLQPGYIMHDRLLRPAMVAVAKGKSGGAPGDVEHIDTTA
ncbi:MAG: nucleotide exchange factor GrpE [Proteobacteria bacterium]|nr:nucleotide exchange factor GrpE [Pseudomonadota bacterium]